ncbi:DUF262 domain-containing protein [Paraclostridium sordellii]|uniref:DUF262 domain-containing protein n=1 Tax=Paraclostridium sordellii TaxID=1505 RepID=UPI0018994906|nr:DUF262 domain-containing protein [Paeniclostridium sordellii]
MIDKASSNTNEEVSATAPEDYKDIEDDNTLDSVNVDINVYPLENIKIVPVFYSVFELNRKYIRALNNKDNKELYSSEGRKNQIILDSDFQREDVWDKKQKSELIESVLMGLPLPMIYLFEDENANLIVVDGRQRLTTFFEYMANEFELKDLNILQDMSGKKFNDLPLSYQSKIEDYQLTTQVIKPPTPDSVKFQIFDRVNRGGTILNNQEMRNALYQGNSTKLLNKLSQLNDFKEAIGRAKSKRMKDKYIILRFIAFYLWRTNQLKDKFGNLVEYKSDIDEFLGKTMEYLNFVREEILFEIENLFTNAMINSYNILGQDGFRLKNNGNRKSPINMNLFETWTYLMVLLNDKNIDKDILNRKYNELISNEVFLNSIGSNRNSLAKVSERFDIIEQIHDEIIVLCTYSTENSIKNEINIRIE